VPRKRKQSRERWSPEVIRINAVGTLECCRIKVYFLSILLEGGGEMQTTIADSVKQNLEKGHVKSMVC